MIQTKTDTHGTLFLAWQDQKTKRYFPVGRLTRFLRSEGFHYQFCYLSGVLKAQTAGFSSFLAFPDMNRVYESNDLFPLFSNRLMPRSRPDFDSYVQRLDLDPKDVDDFVILARSGGRRMTDSLELFPMPELEKHGCYVTFFLAHGIRYLGDVARQRISHLREGDRVRLQWDMDNEADPRALSIRTDDRIVVGYVPRYLLDDAWGLLQDCDSIPEITVAQMNPPPAPLQQRLLCRMESCWPDGFTPYSTDDYLPISKPVDTCTP